MDDSMAITSRYIMPVMLPIDSTNSGMVTQQGAQSRIWQRFWVSRAGLVDLSDAGFLVDPTSRISAAFLGSRPSTLVDLQKYRASAFGRARHGEIDQPESGGRSTPTGADRAPLYFDLRAYSSEQLLYQKIFEGPEVKAWKEGTSQLTLHLDSLDEALLRIDSIASLLAAEIPRLPTKRLYLRIACRTAVWPALTLEPALEQIWEKDSVGVFELAPLRRIDAITAAQDRDIDVEAFFEALFSTNAVPFAIKPLTLNLLLNLFKRDGRLPNSLIELYKNGCLILCEERSPSRHDSLRTGKLNANQRLRLAGRIAAVTMWRTAMQSGPVAKPT
jgi:hypothetical protein